jgi:hypothetical protein
MSFAKRSITTISVFVALSLETLAASAITQNPNSQQQLSTTNPSSTSVSSQESPILLAQNAKRKPKKSKLRRPRPKTSSSLNNKYDGVYYQGSQAVYQCIVEQGRNAASKECREMVAIKSSFINWCYQDSVACIYVDRLASDEIFWGAQVTIMKPV